MISHLGLRRSSLAMLCLSEESKERRCTVTRICWQDLFIILQRQLLLDEFEIT